MPKHYIIIGTMKIGNEFFVCFVTVIVVDGLLPQLLSQLFSHLCSMVPAHAGWYYYCQ